MAEAAPQTIASGIADSAWRWGEANKNVDATERPITRFAAGVLERMPASWSPEKRIAKGRAAAENADTKFQKEDASLNVATDRVKELQESGAEAEEINQAQALQLAHYRARVAFEGDRRKAAAGFIAELNAKHGPALNKLEAAEKKVAQMESQVGALQSSIKATEERIQKLRTEMAALKGADAAYYDALDRAKAGITQQELAVKSMSAKITEVTAEVDKAKYRLQAQREKYGDLLDERKKMQGFMVQPELPKADTTSVDAAPTVPEQTPSAANDNIPEPENREGADSALLGAVRAVIEQAAQPDFGDALKDINTNDRIGAKDLVALWNVAVRGQDLRVLQESEMPTDAQMSLPEFGMYLFNNVSLSKTDVEKGMQRIGDALRTAQNREAV